MGDSFFITTAIDYVNSRPHLGTAYEKITADVIARYKRLAGIDTHFLMGNDEHSQNVYKRAVEKGLDPKAYCDQMEREFRAVWSQLDISFDDFIRTTEPRHRAAVQKLAQACFDKGDIYEGYYEGWYCVSCEAFKQEKDLIEGKCPLHPTLTPEWIREKNYFFRLSKYRDPLLAHFHANPSFLQPESRRNEIVRLLEAGLEDISVSRAGQLWGIPLPFAPDNVVYVWFDALINYAAAVGYGTDAAQFARWWPADLHVIGKDITRFHTVVWPAMLMSAGLPLPRQVFGHGWVNFGGQRMSKSLGTSLDPADVAARFGPDPLRLYLVKEISYGGDGDFTWERYEERYNVDLANNLGNLVSRVAAMAGRYFDGELRPTGDTSVQLRDLPDEVAAFYQKAMNEYSLHSAVAYVFRLVDATNLHIANEAPWQLAKDPAQRDRLQQVLFDAAEAIRLAAVLLLPVMPQSCAEILRRVGETRDASSLRLDVDGRWRSTGTRRIQQGAVMWPRAEEKKLDDQTPGIPANPATQPPAPAPAPAPAAPAAAPADDTRIAIDDFMKVELRTARILEAEAVPKSKKLIKLTVDVGTERRVILAGIAEAYQPEELVGKTIAIVANLKPAKLMGIESNGMVLAASPEGGKPTLITFSEGVEPGWRVR
ncbi:MAG: methionine--tRNA ligase [Vicinamibacterales bacterium]